jgi:hypothetical protein
MMGLSMNYEITRRLTKITLREILQRHHLIQGDGSSLTKDELLNITRSFLAMADEAAISGFGRELRDSLKLRF